MTTGFILAALVAVSIALVFVLVPLLRGGNPESQRIKRKLKALEELSDQLDPGELAQRRASLEKALADSGGDSGPVPALIVALIVAVPLATWGLYRTVGSPEGITSGDTQVEQIRAGLIEIANQLERNPDNIDNWVRLGMAYKDLQEYSSAEHAFRRALYLAEDEPFIQVELAETLLFSSGTSRMPSESRQLLQRAVAIDEGNQKALWLLGLSAFQSGNLQAAINYWERLDQLLSPGTVKTSVQQQLQRARQQLADGGAAPGLPQGHPPIDRPAPPIREGQAMPEGHPSLDQPPQVATRPSPLPEGHPPIDSDQGETSIQPVLPIHVSIDPELANGLTGGESVFITARAAGGPPAPLAVRRMTVAQMPVSLSFSDDDAMLEGLNLSSFPEVIVTARVSMHGQPESQPGDLQGQAGPLSIFEVGEVRVVIDQVVE